MSPAIRVRARGDPPALPGPGPEESSSASAAAWRDLRGRAAALASAAEKRAALAGRLEAALEARRESVRQGAALDEARRRVELQRARVEAAVVGRRRAARDVQWRNEMLQERIQRVLPLYRALAAAHHRAQKAKEALSGDKARLEDLQRLLWTRQQRLVGQVAALYPVSVFHDLRQHHENRHDGTNHGRTLSGEQGTLSEENRASTEEQGTNLLGVSRPPQIRAFTLFGWQILKHKTKRKNYSHKDLQRSAAVLGYATHAVLLIASYLDVPLRYPLRFGGSRSYVSDRLPSDETSPVASADNPSINNTDSKLTEYPLFLEYQEDESTKASYAIYLLHKDTEQLLNYIGAESCGRPVFGNLRELIRIIQSDEYVYSPECQGFLSRFLSLAYLSENATTNLLLLSDENNKQTHDRVFTAKANRNICTISPDGEAVVEEKMNKSPERKLFGAVHGPSGPKGTAKQHVGSSDRQIDQIPAPPPTHTATLGTTPGSSKHAGKKSPAPAPAPHSISTHRHRLGGPHGRRGRTCGPGTPGAGSGRQTGRPRHDHLPPTRPANLFCCAPLILILIDSLWSELLSSPVTLRPPPLPSRSAGGVPAGGLGAPRA
ncbi:hypothetical protein PR202_gb01639 [Eleusine coracana subsp. coracana]|uniref:Uncharacterized protein n=1 Tax=Eleusine coracana subsp. coracana TaxID=191504 RepID=A0AAV5DWK6_ELECO|nr:hypothetical protein PR202_gb01639 [Eleusine coracana subsp. coracana]